jgi:hypothetical protein
LITFDHVSHVYRAPTRTRVTLTRALDDVALGVQELEFVALVGARDGSRALGFTG